MADFVQQASIRSAASYSQHPSDQQEFGYGKPPKHAQFQRENPEIRQDDQKRKLESASRKSWTVISAAKTVK